MTPADTLRAAARLMRQRADAATPGAWVAADSDDVETAWLDYDRPPSPFERATQYRPAPRQVAADHEMGGACARADAEHIASWHPGVALAVATWLDLAASHPLGLGTVCDSYVVDALTVARAYLGKEWRETIKQTTNPTPAELLAAADRTDQAGADATPGPWIVVPDHIGNWAVVQSRQYVTEVTEEREADAAWIALLNPQTGGHIAALLRTLARIGDKPVVLPTASDTDVDALDFSALYDDALALARSILGGDA